MFYFNVLLICCSLIMFSYVCMVMDDGLKISFFFVIVVVLVHNEATIHD